MLARGAPAAGTGHAAVCARGDSKPAVQKRIDWLVQMDTRVRECLAAHDTGGLLVLAGEYAGRNMRQTANIVMRYAESEPK